MLALLFSIKTSLGLAEKVIKKQPGRLAGGVKV